MLTAGDRICLVYMHFVHLYVISYNDISVHMGLGKDRVGSLPRISPFPQSCTHPAVLHKLERSCAILCQLIYSKSKRPYNSRNIAECFISTLCQETSPSDIDELGKKLIEQKSAWNMLNSIMNVSLPEMWRKIHNVEQYENMKIAILTTFHVMVWSFHFIHSQQQYIKKNCEAFPTGSHTKNTYTSPLYLYIRVI